MDYTADLPRSYLPGWLSCPSVCILNIHWHLTFREGSPTYASLNRPLNFKKNFKNYVYKTDLIKMHVSIIMKVPQQHCVR